MLKNIKNMLLGLWVVFKHLFKKPVTLEYPEKRKSVNENFRGKLFVEGCIKCGTCMKVCPSGAIKIDDNEMIDYAYSFLDLEFVRILRELRK